MTTMTKKQEAAEAKARAVKLLREYVKPSTPVYTRTEYTKGMTDYVSVYVAKGGQIHDLTWYVAQATSYRMTDRGLALGGGSYSKGLNVFIATRRAAGREADQRLWRELS